MADPEVSKLAETFDPKSKVTHLLALWNDGTITDCTKPVEGAELEGDIACESVDHSESKDPTRIFYGRLQIEIGLGKTVKVLHDLDILKFIPDAEKFEELK